MRREDVRVAVLRIEGTNSEEETAAAFRHLGAQAEIVHMNQLDASRAATDDVRRLEDYDVLMLPGGFSAGDYVRAGAIWAARLRARHREAIEAFVAEGKPVGGICNGFQVLVELGLLPDLHGRPAEVPEAVLSLNDSDHYECRPVKVRHENRGSCAFTGKLEHGAIVTSVASHAEGKLLLPREESAKLVAELEANDQVVFRYVTPEGGEAAYPWNPSGTTAGIAGVTNLEGNVFGMMPHPERVFHRWQHPDWTRTGHDPEGPGDGRVVFDSVLDHVERRF